MSCMGMRKTVEDKHGQIEIQIAFSCKLGRYTQEWQCFDATYCCLDEPNVDQQLRHEEDEKNDNV